MAEQSAKAVELTHQLRTGAEVVKRLEHDLACASQERLFLTGAHQAEHTSRECVEVEDMRSNLDNMQLLSQRLARYKKLLKAFENYVRKTVCGECRGMGKIRYVICEDESTYEDCHRCKGAGIIE